jgi:hypothetical protein
MAERARRRGNGGAAFFGVSALAALASTAAPLYATVPSVSLGEVSTRVVRSDVDLGEVLRAAVVDQLSTLPSPASSARGPVVLSAALLRMETDEGRVSCVVSATLRTARGGTMIAIVEGRAGVEWQAPVSVPVVRQAVAAATRAAIVRVPDALK